MDASHFLCTSPRTRFVAGFIGRTNLVKARLEGGEIGFDGCRMQAGQLHGVLQGGGRRLRRTAPPLQVHEVGEAVWVESDLRRIALVE